MSVYYNESDAYAAAWLRNLIEAGHLPAGDVDDRSIVDVRPDDLKGYAQCHFFAGIGGWPLALRMAGWPDDRPVWTGSCPCQPFSNAGARQGEKDKRHLWPEFLRLIAEWDVPTLFGEQVASGLGRQWLAGVRTDLEELGYAVGAADLCAAGIGAPHIRQRLYWVADHHHHQQGRSIVEERNGRSFGGSEVQQRLDADGCRDFRRLGDASDTRLSTRQREAMVRAGRREERRAALQPSFSSCWSDCYTIPCSDGKTRRAGSGVQPLAYGVPGRVGRLRAYGNAIVPQVAVQFILATRGIID